MGSGYVPEKEFMSPYGLNEFVMFSDIALYYGPSNSPTNTRSPRLKSGFGSQQRRNSDFCCKSELTTTIYVACRKLWTGHYCFYMELATANSNEDHHGKCAVEFPIVLHNFF